jgi:hypothetical protein
MVGLLRMFSIQGFLTWQSKLLMADKDLSQAERYQFHALMKAGHDQSQISNLLHRHKSTISRELSRNTGSRGYRPKQACEISADRGQNSAMLLMLSHGYVKLPVLCCAFSGAPTSTVCCDNTFQRDEQCPQSAMRKLE